MDFFGRDVSLILEGSTVMCFRTLSMSIDGEPVDISDGCSNARRELSRRGPAQINLEFSVEGVAKTRFLRQRLLRDQNFFFENATLQWPVQDTENPSSNAVGDTLTVDLVLSNYSENMNYNDTTTFSATLQNSGNWIYEEEGA